MSQNIPEETMKKVELLWIKVGFVVQLSQMVEYNLANILGFDEILKKFDDEKPLSKKIYDNRCVKTRSIFAENENSVLVRRRCLKERITVG